MNRMIIVTVLVLFLAGAANASVELSAAQIYVVRANWVTQMPSDFVTQLADIETRERALS